MQETTQKEGVCMVCWYAEETAMPSRPAPVNWHSLDDRNPNAPTPAQSVGHVEAPRIQRRWRTRHLTPRATAMADTPPRQLL